MVIVHSSYKHLTIILWSSYNHPLPVIRYFLVSNPTSSPLEQSVIRMLKLGSSLARVKRVITTLINKLSYLSLSDSNTLVYLHAFKARLLHSNIRLVCKFLINLQSIGPSFRLNLEYSRTFFSGAPTFSMTTLSSMTFSRLVNCVKCKMCAVLPLHF